MIEYPYTDFHELNLDWTLKTVKKAEEQSQEAIEQSAETKEYVDEYFDNLDVQDEVNVRVNQLVSDGTIEGMVTPTVINQTTEWLEDHITQPTTPAIDDSLTVAGAAADAWAVGRALKPVVGAAGIKWLQGYYDNNGGYHGGGTFRISQWMACVPGQQLKMVGKTGSPNVAAFLFWNEATNANIAVCNIGADGTVCTTTVPANCYCFRVGSQDVNGLLEQSYVDYADTSSGNLLYNLGQQIRTNARAIANAAQSICYVDPINGSDSNAGTSAAPFATVGHAVSAGYGDIRLAPAVYSEQVTLNGINNFRMSPWENITAYDITKPQKNKPTFFKGAILTFIQSGAEYVAPYTPASGTRFYDVFVAESLEPVTQGSYAEEFNATAIVYKPGVKARQLRPVLAADYSQQPGTMTYLNGQIRFVPHTSYSAEDLTGSSLYVPNELALSVSIDQCTGIELTDIVSLAAYFGGFSVKNSSDVHFDQCEALCTTHYSGFRNENANVTYDNCIGCGNAVDGFGFSFYGSSVLTGCKGLYNGDDGVSHHHGCIGTVHGGEWAYNGSGGVTPAFGAQVEIRGIYSHDNLYGVAYFGASNYPQREQTLIGSLITGNTNRDVYTDKDNIKAWGLNHVTYTAVSPGTIFFAM